MRRDIIQIVSVAALALGAGLFAFGRHLDPPLISGDAAAVAQSFASHEDDDERLWSASVACGTGIGFMTLGALGLAVPWINTLVAKQHERAGPGAT